MTDIAERLRSRLHMREMLKRPENYGTMVSCVDIIEAADEIDRLQERLSRILEWCEAYPLDVFPEPDFKQARKLLEAGGMTLDAISASNMRHVVNGIKKIAAP